MGLKIATNQITGYDQFAPFIVHLEKPQKHFSIYLGSYYQYLLFADPSIGLYLRIKSSSKSFEINTNDNDIEKGNNSFFYII